MKKKPRLASSAYASKRNQLKNSEAALFKPEDHDARAYKTGSNFLTKMKAYHESQTDKDTGSVIDCLQMQKSLNVKGSSEQYYTNAKVSEKHLIPYSAKKRPVSNYLN